MGQGILQLERVDCPGHTRSKFVVLFEFQLKALNYFTLDEEIQTIKVWLENIEVQIRYQMIETAEDILFKTAPDGSRGQVS